MSEGGAPAGGSASLNTGVAHNARVRNHWIGGDDNYEVVVPQFGAVAVKP